MRNACGVAVLAIAFAGCDLSPKPDHATTPVDPTSGDPGTTIRSDRATEPSAAGQFESPEATFQAAKAAVQRSDYAAFCECWSPDGQKLLAGGIAMLGNMSRAMAEREASSDSPDAAKAVKRAQQIKTLLQRHGFQDGEVPLLQIQQGADPDAQVKAHLLIVAETINDKAKFVSEFVSLMESIGDRPSAKMLPSNCTLENLNITGVMATATVTKPAQASDRSDSECLAVFAQIDGNWKIVEIENLLQ